ncbi:MAG TPA: PPC domain-containing protein [Gemmatimonadaceae bacterium]|nr:PPC domain-containing protein [Gemmatimonadaceae bacterium]
MSYLIGRLAMASTLGAAGLLVSSASADAQSTVRAIRIGQPTADSIGASTPRISGRGGFRTYRLNASAGKRYIISLDGEGFDAFVWVAREVGGLTEELASDDDSGGGPAGTNARLRFRPPSDGSYIIVAQSLQEDGRGPFVLRVEETDPPVTPAAIPIAIGETTHGTITNDSPVDDEQGYSFNHFRLRASGQRVRILLRSDDFDAYLVLMQLDGRGGEEEVEANDDGGGDMNSRITRVLDGEYRIVVRPLSGDGRGSYTLSVEEALPIAVTQRAIAIGQTVNGEIGDSDPESDNGEFFHEYVLQANAGDELRITLRSEEFDSFLRWGTKDGLVFREIATDDDGGGNLDSQLSVRVDAAGQYVIRVSGLGSGNVGGYELTVERVGQ